MSIINKLETLADSAKYDVACTSSGAQGNSSGSGIGNTTIGGVCHSFAADGRCITLLKVLMTNICINDCKYCVNRKSNMKIKREAFSPRELADLTMQFYRRNYIEGLFLSSGIIKSPDYTCELMLETLSILRNEYNFYGYIHAKAIPGADNLLIEKIGRLADRISINIEMPSQNSLSLLAPDKSKDLILKPMGYIKNTIEENSHLPAISRSSDNLPAIIDSKIARSNKRKLFAPAGQSTQMIIGASPESDCHILRLAENLYQRYKLKRVFFSAYIPVSDDSNLPAIDTKPPLLREHRLYQADWLMRFYRFKANEILDENTPNFNPFIDPKCNWALNHKEFFPIEINKAPYANLLRVPGIGVLSAQKIVKARRFHSLDFYNLKKLGVVLKRAQYFILCNGKSAPNFQIKQDNLLNDMMSKRELTIYKEAFTPKQIELFSHQELLAG
ncbi:MAG: putative DNA modification/repair radical SAM protein [Elusimicrobiota bacterium]|jgi:putative DNA modification/repair radical SAM protein|nr:putative DNA modification/repair radical SAM protein [Elusimicrobiota bacterium]